MSEEIKSAEALDDVMDSEEATEVEEQGSDDTFRGCAFERETIINFNNAEKTASYYTLNYGKRQMLLELAKEYPNDVKIIAQREDMVEATLPKSWIKVRPPRKMTEEERQKLVERGRALSAKSAAKRAEAQAK